VGIGGDHLTLSKGCATADGGYRNVLSPRASSRPSERSGRPILDGRIVQAMRLLEENIAEEIDFESIASAVGLSVHRFHHLFAEETGDTPGNYLRRIRLDAAAMRLRWTRETAGHIANALGYESQSAFSAAFERKFGVSPGRFRRDHERWPKVPVDEIKGRRVAIREARGFHCVARRYFGPDPQVGHHWTDFLAALPQGVKSDHRSLYLGLTYDDPRFTAANEIRYDCCVMVSESSESWKWLPQDQGFHRLVTRPGLYACVEHTGGYVSSLKTYALILDNWLVNSRYTLTDAPTIEFYTIPPGRAPDEELQFTLMLSLY